MVGPKEAGGPQSTGSGKELDIGTGTNVIVIYNYQVPLLYINPHSNHLPAF